MMSGSRKAKCKAEWLDQDPCCFLEELGGRAPEREPISQFRDNEGMCQCPDRSRVRRVLEGDGAGNLVCREGQTPE